MLKNIMMTFVLLLCLAPTAQAQEDTKAKPIKVVASFSILGDMIQQVGGQDVDVHTLVGPEEDAHIFQPSPQDAKLLTDADIIAINGLKFEGWMHRLITASGTKAKLLVTSAGVKPRIMPSEGVEIVPDPHAWQDLRNGQLYVKNIAAALIQARPAQADAIKTRARTYIAELDTLDKKTRESFAQRPETERKIITTHDAFGYFGAAYGVMFLSPVGISTEAEPSAADIAKLITQIKQENVRALFIENMSDPRLVRQIAKDTDANIGGTLYADALTKPDGEAPTYLAMMKVNISRILNEGK